LGFPFFICQLYVVKLKCTFC